MCLRVSKRRTRKALLRKSPWVYRYKVVYGNISPIFDYEYKQGWNHSNREKKEFTNKEECNNFRDRHLPIEVTHGIHVYTTLDEAENAEWPFPEGAGPKRIICVKCLLKDLIAVSSDLVPEEAYMKVFVSKEDFEMGVSCGG